MSQIGTFRKNIIFDLDRHHFYLDNLFQKITMYLNQVNKFVTTFALLKPQYYAPKTSK